MKHYIIALAIYALAFCLLLVLFFIVARVRYCANDDE